MQIRTLQLRNYRNYERAVIRFAPGMNILTGLNAQGKTNLLESLVYLSLTRSHRLNDDQQLIRSGCEAARISCAYEDGIERKIEAVINNAQCFQKVRQEHGSFCDWLWAHTDGKTILYMGHENGRIPVSNGLSDKIAKELKAYGFKYLGTVTVYSHLQACGIVNDHGKDCPCYQTINAHNPTIRKRRYLEK